MLDVVLTQKEVRVLGCLMEKKATTPDLYPLSLNALRMGCNQTTSRDPVVSFDDATVADALETLKQKGLVAQDNFSRVPKFEERFLKITDLMPAETAILCVLMLRGPQTGGEIRSRTERLYPFPDFDEVVRTVEALQGWGYVTLLPRQAGQKESRYAHLLCGTPDIPPETALPRSAVSDFVVEHEAFIKLQSDVTRIQQELTELKQTFHDFKSQF